jgi:hypothetical protein
MCLGRWTVHANTTATGPHPSLSRSARSKARIWRSASPPPHRFRLRPVRGPRAAEKETSQPGGRSRPSSATYSASPISNSSSPAPSTEPSSRSPGWTGPAPSGGGKQGTLGTVGQARAGTRISASPSMTTLSPTVHTVENSARRFSAFNSFTVTRATTVSPIFTGALNLRFWDR